MKGQEFLVNMVEIRMEIRTKLKIDEINFKNQLFELLQPFSNTYFQLTKLLNYNQLSKLIAIQIPNILQSLAGKRTSLQHIIQICRKKSFIVQDLVFFTFFDDYIKKYQNTS